MVLFVAVDYYFTNTKGRLSKKGMTVSARHFSVFLQTLDFDDDEFDNIEEILDVFENIQQELMREGNTVLKIYLLTLFIFHRGRLRMGIATNVYAFPGKLKVIAFTI